MQSESDGSSSRVDGVEASGDELSASLGDAVGEVESGPEDACAPGSLDASFGGAGTGLARVSIQPDDAGGVTALGLSGSRIVAAGWGQGGLGGSTFKVARLFGNGAVDASFGGGVVRTQWGASNANYAFARAVGLSRGGRVVVIGGLQSGPRADVALARYLPDGQLDARGFGHDGKRLVDLGGDEDIRGGLVLPDERLLAVGSRDGHLLVARLTRDGDVDAAFGGGEGYFTRAIGESSAVTAVALDAKGRIVVAGVARTNGQDDVLAVRLWGDGEIDESFGEGGCLLTGDPTRDERATSLAVAKNGAIVLAGSSGAARRELLLQRLLPDGSPDPSFGAGGAVITAVSEGNDEAASVASLSDRAILVAGNSTGPDGQGPWAARLGETGELDPSFGAAGVARLNLGEYGLINTMRLDGCGRALVGGGDEGATPGPGTFLVVARMCL